MINKSPRMIKIDQNMSDLWQILCKKYYFNISAFFGFIAWINTIVFFTELLHTCFEVDHHHVIKTIFEANAGMYSH